MFKTVKLSLLIIGTIVTTKLNAQISYFGNTGGTAGNYVGWANTEAFPLQIRHNATGQPVTFFTSNGTPTERMRLTPTGELGLGTTTPASFMHLSTTATGNLFRTDGATGNINRWQLFTGGVEKFRLSVPAGSSNVYLRTANLSTTESSNFYIQTGGTLNRLKINGVYGANQIC